MNRKITSPALPDPSEIVTIEVQSLSSCRISSAAFNLAGEGPYIFVAFERAQDLHRFIRCASKYAKAARPV